MRQRPLVLYDATTHSGTGVEARRKRRAGRGLRMPDWSEDVDRDGADDLRDGHPANPGPAVRVRLPQGQYGIANVLRGARVEQLTAGDQH